MEREAKIQDDLKRLIEAIIKGRRFHGIEITHVEWNYPIDSREADLVLFMRGEVPFMFIETKRKGEGKGTLFDPLDASVVGQVMSYVALWKRSHPDHEVPFVATANPESIAVFRVPKNIEDYIDREAVMKRDYKAAIKRRYLSVLENQMVGKVQKLSLTREFIDWLLDKLAEEYVEKKIIKPEPTEALIDRFRGFVKTVADKCAPLLEPKLKEDGIFRDEVEKLGYKTDSNALPQTVPNLVRMMAYVLMNKLIFRKILEGSYGLPHMVSLDSSSLVKFKEQLNYNFDIAIAKTNDFEPIFRTGVYDQIPIPDDPELMEYINDFIYTLESVDVVKIGDQIGYMYEVLIPPEERHQLGQFYTPPWVCDLITKWCIRDPDDIVLDPGVGSGGFLLQAYKVLQEKKIGPSVISVVRPEVHERILSQLYALDINPFPAHLSAMGVSIKSIKSPSTKLNLLVSDFFAIQPGQKVLSPYKVKTIVREEEREVILPKFDAVVGNPPYTRWTEIPSETQVLIRKRLGKLMKEYGLTPQVSRGAEPGIYTYWVMHATDFLKEGGRLGMIVSDTWLNTGYGIEFGNFLLDHFRIKAVIDFEAKLFKGATISTCILLAEKENDKTKRSENGVVFIQVPGEVENLDIDELLEVIKLGNSKNYNVSLIAQKDLPKDKKWLDIFFQAVDISNHPLMKKLSDYFVPSYGNTAYLFLASTGKVSGVRNPGARGFNYLSLSKVKEFGIEKLAYPSVSIQKAIIYPAITSARRTNFFTFTEDDWKELYKSDEECYMFVCHVPKEKLSKEVADYIGWGENECKTKGRESMKRGRFASQTEAAKTRAKNVKYFYGWYDQGGVISAPLFAVRQARYIPRFTLCNFPVAMYEHLIAMTPKEHITLNEIQTKALLAYLNSSFIHYYIESKGRSTAKGPMGIEANMAREMPVLNLQKLNDRQLNSLAKLFDELEHEARKIGGASAREHLEKLKPKIYEIDRAVATILGIKDDDIRNIEAQVDLMIERRVGAAKRTSKGS